MSLKFVLRLTAVCLIFVFVVPIPLLMSEDYVRARDGRRVFKDQWGGGWVEEQDVAIGRMDREIVALRHDVRDLQSVVNDLLRAGGHHLISSKDGRRVPYLSLTDPESVK